MGAIPLSGELNVEDEPQLSSVKLIEEVIENVAPRTKTINSIMSAASSNFLSAELKDLRCVTDQVEKSVTQADLLISNISSDEEGLLIGNNSLDSSREVLQKVRRLAGLVNDLQREQKSAQCDCYGEVAETLARVKLEMKHFDAVAAIPHVQIVQLKINAIEAELRNRIEWSSREIGQLVKYDPNPDTLSPETELVTDLKTLRTLHLVIEILG